MKVFRINNSLKIREVYKRDLLASKLRKEQLRKELLKFKGKVYLSRKYLEEVIREYYDNPLQGHLEITKIIEIVKRTYATLQIRDYIIEYIKKYV